MLKLSKIIMLGLTLFALLTTSGCDPSDPVGAGKGDGKSPVVESVPGKHADTPDNRADVPQLKIYFSNEDGTKLVAKSKPAPKQDKYAAAVYALIAGTSDNGAVSMIPQGTKLRGIKVEKGVAYVDFSQDLVKKFNGGSTGEIMLVGSIVNTLTEFPEIKAVQFLIEGRKEETISGHMDISEPLKRFEDILKN